MTSDVGDVRNALSPFLMAAFVLFYLWDFYLPGAGIRIFDIVGLVLLLMGLYASRYLPRSYSLFSSRNFGLLAMLMGLCFVFSVVGSVRDLANAKAAVGFMIGTSIFTLFYMARLERAYILKCVNIVLVVGAVYLIIQLVCFHITGMVLNPHSFLGAQNRGLSSVFRPTGLFLEPAGYCLSALMLLILKMQLRPRYDRVVYLTLASILLSVSLWGIISALIFMILYMRGGFKLLLIIAAIVGITLMQSDIDDTFLKVRLMDRVTNVDEDQSADVRYGQSDGALEDAEPIDLFWGKGISNWDLYYGFNGISFLASAGGIAGAVLVMILFMGLMSPTWSLRTLTMIALCMTAWPIWTYWYWWAWLGLLLKAYQEDAYPQCDSVGNDACAQA